MSVTGRTSIGVPVVMVHEAEGCVVTVETVSGHTYRGKCVEAEDNMNLQLKDVTETHPFTGKESFVPELYLRGDQVLMVIFPEILKHAPMFKRLDNAKHGKHVQGGMGYGRTRALRSKVELKARAGAVKPAVAPAAASFAPRPGMPVHGMAGGPGRGMAMAALGAGMGMGMGMGAPGRGPPPAGRGVSNLPAWMTRK